MEVFYKVSWINNSNKIYYTVNPVSAMKDCLMSVTKDKIVPLL